MCCRPMNDSTLARLSTEIGWAAGDLIESLLHVRLAVEVLEEIRGLGKLASQLDEISSTMLPIRDQLAAHAAAIEAALMCDLADQDGAR